MNTRRWIYVGPVLKYPGAKWSLAKWIVSHMPPHRVYLEPFFGSGAVFFAKWPSHIETINDIDGQVVNMFRIIRERPDELAWLIEMTPWARAEYYESYELTGDPLEDARRFLVRCWQAHGAKLGGKCGWRNDIQGRKGTNMPLQWKRLPMRILAVAERLKDVQIECQPALKLIERYRHPEVLIYADPPYPLSTRTRALYRHEMTEEDHIKLLDALDRHPGPVLLSGYSCPLYDERLRQWTKRTARALAEGGREREEVLWLNPIATEKMSMSLFWNQIPEVK
ncbi:MAG: DNA adenine methylase [Thermoanaerobacter sp.]|nr:DNA adenine methylase [Thermoanaerobacter sp.]